MSEASCVCGHVKEDHTEITDCDAEISRDWCRVHINGKRCECEVYRPVPPWPDAEGLWHWEHELGKELILASEFGTEVGGYEMCLLRHGFEKRETKETAKRFGPARFTRLLEPNPFNPAQS